MTYEAMRDALKDGVSLTDEQLRQYRAYATLLAEWNQKMNLTAITEEGEVVEKHFYDSLLPSLSFRFPGKSLLDMGTGAGFPGLALAIAFPDLSVTLADSTAKKFVFLKDVVAKLGLKNVGYAEGRVEEMKNRREHYDVVTARSFSSLPALLEVGMPLLRVGGTLIAYKGSKGAEELHAANHALQKLNASLSTLQKASLPSEGDARAILFFKKEGKTPSRYPRRWGDIEHHPL